MTVYQGSKWRVVETQVIGWGLEYTVEWLTAGEWIPGLTYDDKAKAVSFAEQREAA
jgi:hypothetical protein